MDTTGAGAEAGKAQIMSFDIIRLPYNHTSLFPLPQLLSNALLWRQLSSRTDHSYRSRVCDCKSIQ